MSLRTSKVVTRYSWTVLPMPKSVIKRVEELGKDQPEYLVFKDRHGNEIGDIEITGVDGDEALQNVDEPALEEDDSMDDLNMHKAAIAEVGRRR